ncbi:PREDICTED: uncharacterized protein LOC104748347 [Camelina sativa]|uniref:Uncharacterized protein LOC104748347 n=1 Tax=Camelina sativa TaxID=90675 RepID=A0ABM0WAX2_CAMSA|nr:PREDICTED: uncharacterized protein LOC104748347 [Camelina sativa]
MKEFHIKLPFLESIKNTKTYKKCLKDVLSYKKSIEEGVMMISTGKAYVHFEKQEKHQRNKEKILAMAHLKEEVEMVSSECNAIIPIEIPKKLGDPGSFVLPCQIGRFMFERCLCDLGASVNLMPLSVSERLGITNFKPSRISLVLADRSVRSPVGLVEDVHVRVGNFYIPTDFTVLELDKEPHDPLILGRPFLHTVGAMIDVKKQQIHLQIGDHTQEFDMRRLLKKPTIGGQAFSIETIDDPRDKYAKTCIGWSEVKEVLDGDLQIPVKKVSATCKVKPKWIKENPHVTLTPMKCVGDTIEYKVQCKGTSKPFSKARSILTS